jgi:tetrahydromethanopterin S-methyltransferase subunit F
MISEPDYSAIDRAVEKVIAKHELMFTLDVIMQEKFENSAPIINMMHIYSKAARMTCAISSYKQKLFAINQTKQGVTSSGNTYRIDGIAGGVVDADSIIKLLKDAQIDTNTKPI